MGWDKDSLIAKSKIFFEKAHEEEQDDIFFGLFCAIGLELLARAAISKVSPALLAEPANDHKNILYVFNYGAAPGVKKSIMAAQVVNLCKTIIPDFDDAAAKSMSAIINRRNEEVHTGIAAFKEYPSSKWLSEFYRICKLICAFLIDENLETLFGKEIASTAEYMITETDKKKTKEVLDKISAHEKVFKNKSPEELNKLRVEAEVESEKLSHLKWHKVECPACKCLAAVQGKEYGKEHVEHTEIDIITRRSVMPEIFKCTACGLKMSGYGELIAAGVGAHYTNRTHYLPEEYYELISPDDIDTMERYVEENRGYYEYSND